MTYLGDTLLHLSVHCTHICIHTYISLDDECLLEEDEVNYLHSGVSDIKWFDVTANVADRATMDASDVRTDVQPRNIEDAV